MKKYLRTVIISLLIGFFLSLYMIKQYESVKITPVFNKIEQAYFLQQGVYSTEESMKKNTANLTDYIYSIIDNMYHVYIGVSLDNDNILKLQDFYKNKNIKTIIKKITISDTEYINFLNKYDEILRQTEDQETIKELCKESLEKYKDKG